MLLIDQVIEYLLEMTLCDQIEVLQAEVTALKALVLTSTPSKPNPHLNPQIDKMKKMEVRGHRRSTSHHSFIKEIQLPKFNLHNEVRAVEPPKPVEEVRFHGSAFSL